MSYPSAYSESSLQVICDSIRPRTRLAYCLQIRRWMAFCLEENVPANRPEPDDIARCLLLFQYAVACHLRAALGFALPLWGCDVMVSSAPVLKRVVRGIWNRKPVLRRGTGVWDPSVVLSFLKSGGPTDWATDVKWLRGKAVTIIFDCNSCVNTLTVDMRYASGRRASLCFRQPNLSHRSELFRDSSIYLEFCTGRGWCLLRVVIVSQRRYTDLRRSRHGNV